MEMELFFRTGLDMQITDFVRTGLRKPTSPLTRNNGHSRRGWNVCYAPPRTGIGSILFDHLVVAGEQRW
jgi:hypothetical protein